MARVIRILLQASLVYCLCTCRYGAAVRGGDDYGVGEENLNVIKGNEKFKYRNNSKPTQDGDSNKAKEVTAQTQGSSESNANTGETCEAQAQRASQPVQDCGLQKDDKQLLMLTSSGITDAVKDSFEELVKSMPGVTLLADRPEYSSLKVLVLYDPCMLKKSFWTESPEDGGDINKVPLKNLKDVGQKFLTLEGKDNAQLDRSYCYLETSEKTPGNLATYQFGTVTQTSLMDHLMSPEEFTLLAKADLGLASDEDVASLFKVLQEKDEKQKVPEELAKLIEEADIIATSGGNPDLMAFVYEAFPSVRKMISDKINDGKAIFVGRSAGSMIAGANPAFSNEPTPSMYHLVSSSGKAGHLGLDFLPSCIVKPHFKTETWEVYSQALEQTTSMHVVRIANGQGLRCLKGCCHLVGTAKAADLEFDTSSHYNEHLGLMISEAGEAPKPSKKEPKKSAADVLSIADAVTGSNDNTDATNTTGNSSAKSEEKNRGVAKSKAALASHMPWLAALVAVVSAVL